jgi:hypothetical protein
LPSGSRMASWRVTSANGTRSGTGLTRSTTPSPRST